MNRLGLMVRAGGYATRPIVPSNGNFLRVSYGYGYTRRSGSNFLARVGYG